MNREKENFFDSVFALPVALLGPIFDGAESNCNCTKILGGDSGLLAQVSRLSESLAWMQTNFRA